MDPPSGFVSGFRCSSHHAAFDGALGVFNGFSFIFIHAGENSRKVRRDLLAHLRDELNALLCNAHHDLTAVFSSVDTLHIHQFFETIDEAGGRGRGVLHPAGDFRHCERLFFLGEEAQEQELRKREPAANEFLRKIQDKGSLEDDKNISKSFGGGLQVLAVIVHGNINIKGVNIMAERGPVKRHFQSLSGTAGAFHGLQFPIQMQRLTDQSPSLEMSDALADASIPQTRGTVLLLEDDPQFKDIMNEFLHSHGFQVVSVQNGVEGVHEVLAKDFEIILCDMMMPTLPGDMFFRAVERMRPHLCSRFIFMTGHRGNVKITDFIRNVNGTILSKPFHVDDLLEMIAFVQVRSAVN